MNRVVAVLILLLVPVFSVIAADDINNPQPLSDDLVLPMPNDGKMVFRPVFIGVGDGPWDMKEFKVGDRSAGGFREYPTRVVIGGAFIANNLHDMRDWVYYIGKYEVTEAQYYSIMIGEAKNPQYPIRNISWFEAQDFINKYTLWLYKNARDQIPKQEETYGYLRLPTEIEWEFAARGGAEVDSLDFDKRHPYDGSLTQYEWFSGKKSSHGKVKKIGLLKPNPLKLHDMLGNVSEMTITLYHVEYYQGRPGGFTLRGGNVFTSEGDLRSSMRAEIPFYKMIKGELTTIRQPTLGIRLVISSPIYTSQKTSKTLAETWEDYRVKRRPPMPAIEDHPETERQVSKQVNSLLSAAHQLEKNDAIKDFSETQLAEIIESAKNIDSITNKAAFDSAYAFVKIASNTLYMIYSREIKELPGKQNAFRIAKKLGKTQLIDSIEKQIETKEKNIREGLISYGEMFQELEKISSETVKSAIDKYGDYLLLKGAADQNRVNDLFATHFDSYQKTRRTNADQWRKDLERL